MVKNEDVAKIFANGWYKNPQTYTKNMFIRGNAIYSYGEHFPIAYKFNDGTALFNTDKYSSSTSRHQGYVKRALEKAGYKLIYVKGTELNDAVNSNAKTYQELVVNEW